MSLPCYECIKYAVCKHKTTIQCQPLHEYVDKRNSFPKQFKNLKKIRHEAKGKLSLFSIRFDGVLNKGTTRWFPDS